MSSESRKRSGAGGVVGEEKLGCQEEEMGSKRRIVRLLQLTEPNSIYGTDERKPGKRKIGWAQAIYPLRARLQELKTINLLPEKWDDALEDELIELKSGE